MSATKRRRAIGGHVSGVILALTVAACTSKKSVESEAPPVIRPPQEQTVRLSASRAAAPAVAGQSPPQTEQPAISPPAARKIIRHANQRIEVQRADAALGAIRRMVGELGGYTTDESHQQADNGTNTASITCRVPSDKLDQAIARVRQLGTQETLNITAEDVTAAYFDLEVQIANQKRLEARLLDLLNRQTNRLSDLLEVERETARVRGEIDQLEGRKRYWDNQLALSTLVITLHEPRPAIASASGGAWRTLRDAFGDAGDNFVLTIAAIISSLGALVPLAVVLLMLFLAVRWAWRRRRARKP